MGSPPPLDRYDAAAVVSVGCLLVVAQVVPHPTVRYAAWLTISCVWMAWFVSFGAQWLYGTDR